MEMKNEAGEVFTKSPWCTERYVMQAFTAIYIFTLKYTIL